MKIGDVVVHKEWKPYNSKQLGTMKIMLIACNAVPDDWLIHLAKMPREIIKIENGLSILENRYSARDLPQIEVSEKDLNNFWIPYNEKNYYSWERK